MSYQGLDESFYREEIRSDYLVTEEYKKLWAIELESLEKLKEVCEKYGLKYYAIGGTLIGAARHKGFIPWDDDIDIVMFYEDYKKLLEVGAEEFQYPFFLQTYKSNKEFDPNLSRLRRSDTTGFTKWEKECVSTDDYNKGIFIDILPLFNVPDSKLMILIQRVFILSYWKANKGYEVLREKALTGKSNLGEDCERYVKWYRLFSHFMNIDQIKQKYLDVCAWFDRKKTKRVAVLSFRCKNERLWNRRECYEQTVEMPFENTTISVPAGYDEILTNQYGDWHIPVQNTAMHEMGEFDTDTPYTEYLRRQKENAGL